MLLMHILQMPGQHNNNYKIIITRTMYGAIIYGKVIAKFVTHVT